MSDAHGVARDQLRAFIERIERLEEEKKTLADDIKDVYGEAKSMGFDTKILRKVISIRKQDTDERLEQEAILATYLSALGMIQMDMFEEPEQEASPKLVATVATGMQTQAGRAALLTAVDIMIEREERFDAETGEILDDHTETATAYQGEAVVPRDERETDREAATPLAGANAGGEDVDGSAERASSVATSSGPDGKRATNSPEQATEFHAKASDDACEAGRKALGRAEASAEAPDGAELVSRGVVDRAATATSENGRDSLERQAPTSIAKPKFVLRPHCLNPGEACGGYSDKHCHACTVAMRKREQAEEVA
ncbi:DUF2312 domain-containing protein [Sinorhizobium meliloti]|nr:DUF2312 domain-containing protein [Sinorhizobium meliloti]MDW9846914.1 DUF2312 domain-containing protein [Sinorhizobium meliloti]MDX0143718.1 DUF2312 domain-containing protein [Sinorhizobium meliloti]MDX0149743.1 DUF2312 domain-containing protein [Sinorhizobium meliloti]MDX0168982.1 DUF2312 domain-containing protein [Sinorhizobium meliloti]